MAAATMPSTRRVSAALLVVAAVMVMGPGLARAQVATGQGGVCCAFIPDASGNWQLVCNDPSNIPGAQPFPGGTIVSGVNFYPGQIAQCVGRFPYPNPYPFTLPATGQQLFSTPNGVQCADQFPRFYQGLGPDGGFVVQCTY